MTKQYLGLNAQIHVYRQYKTHKKSGIFVQFYHLNNSINNTVNDTKPCLNQTLLKVLLHQLKFIWNVSKTENLK